jgi:hypothetical protein
VKTARYAAIWMPLFIILSGSATGVVVAQGAKADAPENRFASHSPMRPLPVASSQTTETGTGRFRYVDSEDGDDTNAGGEKSPWKSLAFSLRQLEPGDTLFLREGTYYEKTHLSRSGSEDQPITIRSYPGELAILDGGRREFFEDPKQAWMPNPDGAPGEFISTRTYHDADARRVPTQFLPAAWEPMWGIEEERPLALGHFGDSMVPLHSYRIASDMRATNEFWIGDKHEMRETGIYCGPGLWFNRQTGRIHIRLAHHQMPGLGQQAYRGETDPRKLQLSVSVGFGEEVLRINGVRHVRLQDLVFRGATGSPMIYIYGSQHIELDHLTVYGGFPALLVNASQKLRVTNSALRGLAAPWTSRAHMKYRGTASYQIVFRNDQPRNEDIELAWCEFTDDHDFAFLRYVRNLQFHHNFVDNFNDDGLECGPKLRDHTLFIYQNRIGRCLIPLTQHEIEKDEAPLDHDPDSGVYVYRNVFDMRGGTYKGPPIEPDPAGEFLRSEGHLVGDHGGPVWPVMRVYHNTFLRETPVWRNYFLFGLGAQGMRQNERDVFNNIFVQTDLVPGVTIHGKQAATLREGGNLLWGTNEGPQFKGDLFGKFRSTPLFELSRSVYSPGWTTQDRVADPGFVSLDDQRLLPDGHAVNAGQILPAEWPDPLKQADADQPDSGVLPAGAKPWAIGVNGRLSLFGGSKLAD